MKISELIIKLEEMRNEFGNVAVFVKGVTDQIPDLKSATEVTYHEGQNWTGNGWSNRFSLIFIA